MGDHLMDDFFKQYTEDLRAHPPVVTMAHTSESSSTPLTIGKVVLIVVLAVIALVLRYYVITFIRLLCFKMCGNSCLRESLHIDQRDAIVVVVEAEPPARSTPPRLRTQPAFPPGSGGGGGGGEGGEGATHAPGTRELSPEAAAPPPSYEQAVRATAATDACEAKDARHTASAKEQNYTYSLKGST